MKYLTTTVVALLLTACAGPRYYAQQPAAEGGYYIASSPAHTVQYNASYYGAFQAYGIYPWWEYAYYSPNFYPHYFAVWYPPWPHGYRAHHSRYGHGFPPHWGRPRGDWAGPTNHPTPPPVEAVPLPTVRLPDRPAAGRGRPPPVADLIDLEPNTLRRRHRPMQPVPAPSASPRLPAAAASMPTPAVQPLTGARASSLALPSRPAAQRASYPTKSWIPPKRERRISRRDPAPYEP